MWFIIAKKELLYARRDKLFIALAAITWLLLVVAGLGGYERYKHWQEQKAVADHLFQQEWEAQQANPHTAAHFGTWLFKPTTLLTLYDNGLNNYTGISYRVEAHKQHEVNYSTVQDTDSQLRFGELSVALVFQLMVPLLIIVLSYSSISREREANTLRLIRVQGGSPSSLLWGKVFGNYAIILLLLLPALVAIVAGTVLLGTPDLVSRSLIFCTAYLLYFFLITVLTVLISGWSNSSSNSLVTSLGAWVICCILLPRTVTHWADQAAPLPSRYAFNRSIQEGYSKGLGNDGTVLDRWKQYQQQVLKQYKVDSVSQLPVNFDGLSMQFGEDYTSRVYQRVAYQTDSLIRRQQTLLETASLADPFMAIQQISMGLSGTDYFHHLSFHHQARAYRDQFIRRLNLELANNGGKYQTYDYKVGPAYFKTTQVFNWQSPTTGSAINWHTRAWIAIFVWLAASVLLLLLTAKKLAQ